MKHFKILFVLQVASLFCSAESVNVVLAEKVAKNFLSIQSTSSSMGAFELSLAYSYPYTSSAVSAVQSIEYLIYVFNVNSGNGFVLVSADNSVIPILGYSTEVSFDPDHLAPAFQNWLEGYKSQILFAKQNNVETTDEISAKWQELENTTLSSSSSPNAVSAVLPLLSTTWDQRPFYNTFCPAGSPTGCAATAMAQIMKFWNFPVNGSGFHSYNHATYGTQTANFGATTYDWLSMPSSISSANNAVATLMYHCGVAVNMNYSPTLSSAFVIINSSQPTANSEYAYKTYFGYDPNSLQGLKRTNYSDAAWKNLLSNELDNSRPFQYAGFGSGGGHTFVCDGYDANTFFHMNWGWGGIDDGYFAIDALNPATLGTGGGTGGFNDLHQAVIGIKPYAGGTPADIDMNSVITVNPSPIGFAQPFTVNADVINSTTVDFSGEYCAALFSASGNFVNYIQIITTGGTPLQPGNFYPGGLNFTSPAFIAAPGNYSVGIYFKPNGGNWQLAGNATYANPVNVTITGPVNALEVYSNIIVTPSTLVQGQAASVNVNFKNTGAFTYFGTFSARLFNMNGVQIETIGSYSETTGLAPGFVYTTPYITFNTAAIIASPGTYILAIMEQQSGLPNAICAGGTFFSTPINIDVSATPILADTYEPNNTSSTPYSLPLTWTSNCSYPKTTGSNMHIGSDYDYYKIDFDAGWNYSISLRVHDKYSSGNGNIYTNDVLWSFDTSGVPSHVFDDVMSGNIFKSGSGSMTVWVSPFFAGQTGTYLLDFFITRTAIPSGVGVSNVSCEKNLEIIPNPVKNSLQIYFSEHPNLSNIKIRNVLGQLVFETTTDENSYCIDVSGLSKGVYFIEAILNEKKYSTRFAKVE